MTETQVESTVIKRDRLKKTMQNPPQPVESNGNNPTEPIKSPFLNKCVSNRDSGYGNDSPASLNTGGHFPLLTDEPSANSLSDGNITNTSDFEKSSEMAEAELIDTDDITSPLNSSTPIAIPRRPREERHHRAVSHHRPIQHRYSTGSFGYLPSESQQRSISTQTPSLPGHAHVCEQVQWQLDSGEDYEFGATPLEQQNTPTARGAGLEQFQEILSQSCAECRTGLPDVVQVPRRRRSEPHVRPYRRDVERDFGRELQRISDEFHVSYQCEAGRPSSIREESEENFEQLPSSFPGAAPTERNWWCKFKTFLSPNSVGRNRSQSDVSERTKPEARVRHNSEHQPKQD